MVCTSPPIARLGIDRVILSPLLHLWPQPRCFQHSVNMSYQFISARTGQERTVMGRSDPTSPCHLIYLGESLDSLVTIMLIASR